ncbi:MAG: xylulokinase [Acidobacteriaceae bacterium]|nr:xylulokinase [Acidobacteriaceae bacterium]
MNQQGVYLGIDCGTQGTKALLLNASGEVLGRGYGSHRLIERPSGAREQEPSWWVDAMCEAVRQALEDAPGVQVAGLGVSGHQHGLVVLDEAMQVIRPAKLWNDTETAPQNEELLQRFGGKAAFFERFGIVPLTGYTVSKLLWMQEKEPENFSRIRHILMPHEYLNYWLTGRLCSESGDASGTAYYDVRKRCWAREVLDAVDGGTGQLFAALPELLDSTACIGTLRPEVAQSLGLPGNTLVSSGGGDNMMGAIGTGNVREGIVTLSLGTSCTVFSYSSTPVFDPTGNVAPFCSSTGGWLPLVCTMNATNVVTGATQLLGKGIAEVDAALERTPPGADGLVFLPFLNGERTPDLPEARGSLYGIAPENFTAAHLIRATVEGVSYGILNGLDLILKGRPAEVIQLIGGGSRSHAWRQLLADASGAVIQVPEEEEAGCLGAAIQAMYVVAEQRNEPVSFEELAEQLIKLRPKGTAQPRAELRDAYDKARAAYNEQLRRSYPNGLVR